MHQFYHRGHQVILLSFFVQQFFGSSIGIIISVVFIIGAEIGKLFDERLDKKHETTEWIDITEITQ